jgi:hypothetical protein
VTLAVTGNTISGPFFGSAVACILKATIDVDRKSMGHTVAEPSCKDADLLCISCF